VISPNTDFNKPSTSYHAIDPKQVLGILRDALDIKEVTHTEGTVVSMKEVRDGNPNGDTSEWESNKGDTVT